LVLTAEKILHFSTTDHPTQEWLSNEISQAFAKNPKPKYLIRDRDCCYGRKFSERLKQLGIREHVIAKQSPWQNMYVERAIWTIRRECLNHVIIMNERHLRRILTAFVDYYNRSRTHYSLDQDSPISRPTDPPSKGNKIVAIPQIGGLHHRYERRVA
jgi:putative transposase